MDHLSILVDPDAIDIWTEERIQPGDDWYRQVTAAIRDSHAAILLISASFLSSAFARNQSLAAVLRQFTSIGIRIIPVILRHCAWDAHPLLGGLSPLPEDGGAIAAFEGPKRDRILALVCKRIVELARDIELTEATADLGGMQQVSVTAASIRDSPLPLESGEYLGTVTTAQACESLARTTFVQRGIDSIEQVSITILESPNPLEKGMEFVLRENPTAIGRDPQCHIFLSDTRVSRRHATIELVAGRLFVRDMGSSNGTRHNGQIIGGGKIGKARNSGESNLRGADILEFGENVRAYVSIKLPES